MVRNVVKFMTLPMLVGAVLIAGNASNKKVTIDLSKYSTCDLDLKFDRPQLEEDQPENFEYYTPYPFTGNAFLGFKEALAFKESRGDYSAVNTYGYLGKYQFGKSTLAFLGVEDTDEFLENPVLQEQVFVAYTKRNKWILRRDIKRFSGTYVNGIRVTESGILAAAHLMGAGSVKKYLRSDGENTFQDAYGTTIESYLKKFSGYSFQLKADRNPNI